MSDSRQIFTLQQVASSIKKTIEARYQQSYWVKAEMHKVNRYPSGHAFPELVQKEEDKIVAQMSGTIWNQHFERINKQFITVVKEPLKEGTLLLLQVKVTFSEIFGLSLQILDIDPSFSLGELQRERDETLKRLQKEGLLNLNQLLNFPLLPKRIAVISADTSKGYSDFMKVIEQNNWGYRFFTMLFPAYLQGDVAVSSIISQLERIKKVQQHFDVVVIVRGGGGEVGLTCYNNYELCKAIATFPLPVLSGIGHSTNLTVAEMISFRNAITPTELGEFLIQSFHEFSVPIEEARKSIRRSAIKMLDWTKNEFLTEMKHFKNASGLFLNRSNHHLQNSSRSVQGLAKMLLSKNRELINRNVNDLRVSGSHFIKEEQAILMRTKEVLKIESPRILENSAKEIRQMEDMVRLLDPFNVLKRGFSISTVNGETIKSNTKLQIGTKVKTLTVDFELTSEIIQIEKNEQ